MGKVIKMRGVLKEWDVKCESLGVGSGEGSRKKKVVLDLGRKYVDVGDRWEMEGRKWWGVEV